MREVATPIELLVRLQQDEVEVFGESGKSVKDPQARPSLEGGDVEEVGSPEQVQRDFLEDFLDGLILFRSVHRVV